MYSDKDFQTFWFRYNIEFQLIPFVLTKVFHTSNSMRGSRSMPRILLSLLNRKRRYVYATQIFWNNNMHPFAFSGIDSSFGRNYRCMVFKYTYEYSF